VANGLLPKLAIHDVDEKNYTAAAKAMVQTIRSASMQNRWNYKGQFERELVRRMREEKRRKTFGDDKSLFDVLRDKGEDVMI
jgi:hypothetical protein